MNALETEVRCAGCSSTAGLQITSRHVEGALIRQLFFGALAASVGWASAATLGRPPANWTSADAPCAKYDELRDHFLGNIGVKIDVGEPWADGFRRALKFWNTVLAANFYEETDLNACNVRIINGGPGLLKDAIIARSQIPGWTNFRGKIAVSPTAAKELSSGEIYGTAVHELGHILGLRHNVDIRSVMYFLDVDGTEVLDSEDMLALSRLHELRPAILSRGFLANPGGSTKFP